MSGTRILESLNPRILPVGISMGDPAGVGPEVILKALQGNFQLAIGNFPVRIIGSRRVFEREQRRLGTRIDLSLVDDSVPGPGRFVMGRVQKSCGAAALESLEAGVEMLESGTIAALVTAPVSKEALRRAGFAWPGQTEFLAERLGAKRYAMLAWTSGFKAVFVTIHLPLERVSRHITPAAVAEKAVLLDQFLRREGSAKPRIAVLAFNPHGFEFSLGEEARIAAGVRVARRLGVDAVGPIPADAAVAKNIGPITSHNVPCPPGDHHFDGFVAMYHDQAMIPAKLLARGRGVNVTLGLGHVRTSPLHGVAFDIAGKGIADPSSMAAAIELARRLIS